MLVQFTGKKANIYITKTNVSNHYASGKESVSEKEKSEIDNYLVITEPSSDVYLDKFEDVLHKVT